MLNLNWLSDQFIVDESVAIVSFISAAVRDMFEKCSFYEKVPKDNIYLTIHDGVIAALSKRREILDEVSFAVYQVDKYWLFNVRSYNGKICTARPIDFIICHFVVSPLALNIPIF